MLMLLAGPDSQQVLHRHLRQNLDVLKPFWADNAKLPIRLADGRTVDTPLEILLRGDLPNLKATLGEGKNTKAFCPVCPEERDTKGILFSTEVMRRAITWG